MLPTRVDGDLFHYKLAEGRDLPRHGHVVAVAESQAAVGPLAASVDPSFLGHDEQALGAAGNMDRFEVGKRL